MVARRIEDTEETASPVQETTDIKTSALEPRLAFVDDKPMQFSPVLHDQPLREIPAVNTAGKRFGTNILPESICVSAEQARGWLQLVYGQDVADSMLARAADGTIINGETFKVQDSQARTAGKISVTSDKSRPGSFVLVPAVLKQSGGKRK